MQATNSTNDDNSGLHDLKALASSTKQRRSQRLSSQMEAQASLLQSAASLEAVALPDPDKEQPVQLAAVAIAPAAVAADAAIVAHETATPNLPSIGTPPASKSKFLLIGGLAIVAAGAVAFYMMRGAGGDSGNNDSTSAANAMVVPAAAEEIEEAAVEPAAAEVAVAPLVVDETATEEEVAETDETATEEAATEEVVAEEAAEEKVETAASKKSEKGEKKAKNSKEDEAVKLTRAEKKAAKLAAKEEAKAKREAAKAAKAEKKAAKSDAKAPTLGEGGASLDDVLSSVTGGVDKPIVEKKDDKPSKKKLERGDIAKAMKAITPAAKGCYSAEEFSGSVMVKYSVSPSGSMTKATALGAHKSSKTGKCVVKAVKKAKFPAFSGATQSFTFPFLLSP